MKILVLPLERSTMHVHAIKLLSDRDELVSCSQVRTPRSTERTDGPCNVCMCEGLESDHGRAAGDDSDVAS